MADGVVYVGADDTNVYAFDSATGTELWSFANGLPVGSSLAVAPRFPPSALVGDSRRSPGLSWSRSCRP